MADREGQVFGETTPSASGVSVIGSPNDDYAINVYFEDLKESFWFSEDLVERIDQGEGTVIRLDGLDTEWVRLSDGEWQERPRKG